MDSNAYLRRSGGQMTGKLYDASGVEIVGGGGEGAGTVTSVSVTTANGVSGSVATATTTPAITLTLGAITPSSVAATGNVTGANLGTASAQNVGTSAGNVVQLDGSAKLPAVDGSQLTNVSGSGGATWLEVQVFS
jgi:hypothetical protein